MSTRLPEGLAQIEPLSPFYDGPYPPKGFASFEEHALGNGDVFGLYWPVGLATEEPLVAETVHDAWIIVPAFSSLSSFISLTAESDDHPEWPTVEQDPMSPHACHEAARRLAQGDGYETAIPLLTRALSRLPEYTAALCLLHALQVRTGDHSGACRTAVRAVRSPPSFAMNANPERVWGWLSRQKEAPEDVLADPIWKQRAALNKPPRGGAKDNPVYSVLDGAVDDYIRAGDASAALCLMQTYAEFMNRETVSFMERWGFNNSVHRARMAQIEAELPGGAREF